MIELPPDQVSETVSAGKPLDFSMIVAMLRPQIYRFLLRALGDADTAETLTQECLLKAHRHWHNFRGQSSAKTWMFRIAINLQKDYWRNKKSQFWREICIDAVDLEEAGGWLSSKEPSAESLFLAHERLERVWNAVDELSDKQRTVFLLRFVDELEISEIAQSTGLREGTVKAHLARARSYLSKVLIGAAG